jgi:hypothetical protein
MKEYIGADLGKRRAVVGQERSTGKDHQQGYSTGESSGIGELFF